LRYPAKGLAFIDYRLLIDSIYYRYGSGIVNSFCRLYSGQRNCWCIEAIAVNVRRGRRPKPLASSKHRVTPLGTALRAWRDYRGLSQTALAIQAGLGVAQDGRAHISSIELGKIQRPEDETLEKIGAVLGVTPNDLRSGYMPPTDQMEETVEPAHILDLQESPNSEGDTFGQEIGHEIDRFLAYIPIWIRRIVEPRLEEALSSILNAFKGIAESLMQQDSNAAFGTAEQTTGLEDEESRKKTPTADAVQVFLNGMHPNLINDTPDELDSH
jgi:transcriptional regulator with XRE-family HTH domain